MKFSKLTSILSLGLLYLAMTGCKPNASAPPASEAEPTLPPIVPPPPPTAPKEPAEPAHNEVKQALMHFQLPTTNTGLYTKNNDSFFMYVKRATKTGDVKVWQGGNYGFVRDPKMAKDGSILYTRFHEGMDVAPMIRDLKGEPQDTVGAIAAGTVVYVNNQAGKSNYGNYVIIEHATEDGPFYSLSAHFREVKAVRGATVKAGEIIGIMGHTGIGIDRERSHTHVELNLLLSNRAAIWNQTAAPTPASAAPVLTATGKVKPAPVVASGPVLNGQNLVGLNIAQWLLTHYNKPSTRLADFIHTEPAYFKLRIPAHGNELEITKRYPWLRAEGPVGQAWEIEVSAASLPLKISPIAEKVDFPVVSWVQPFVGDHAWKSREMLSGTGSVATLSVHGQEWLRLLLAE